MTLIPTREQPPRLAAAMPRPAQFAAAGPTVGMGPRQFLRIIRKRKWLISLTLVLSVAAACAVTYLWGRLAPIYEASAYLKVSPPPETIIEAGRTPIYGKEIIERYKRTWASLVKHQKVWTLALEDPRVTHQDWYARNKQDILEAFDEDIDVTAMPETELIRLSMSGTNKRELPEIVNAVADAFVKFASENPAKERQDQIQRLKEQETLLENQLAALRADIRVARSGAASAALPERQSLVSINLEMLGKQVAEAEIQQAEAAAAMESQKQGSLESHPRVLNALEMDPQLRALESRKMELQTSLENAAQKFQPSHRTVQSLRNVMESTERLIEGRRREVIRNTTEQIDQERQLIYALTTERLADLRERLNKAKANARDLEETLGIVQAKEQQVEDITETLKDIKDAINRYQLLVKAGPGELPEARAVTLLATATEPREPIYPRWSLNVPLGVFFGLALGFGLAFLLELTDTSVKTPSDIARRVDLPLLAMIPHSDDLDEEVEDFRRVALAAPRSPAAEAFRQLRTNLLYSGPAQQRRSLLVTSPAPEDGRTTVVISLAVAMAQAGKRVLVVDANFRQPALAELFPKASPAGLSSALVGQAVWRDAVSPTEVPNLFVMTSGPQPPNPAELFGSEAMRQLVSEMAAEYDQVIFDGSPAMVVADACVLSTQVDGVILVVRAGSNNVGMVQKTSEQLSRIGAHVLGVVLQGVRTTAGGYLRRNYETFYEYQQKVLP